jgi:NADH-quinone oxidoreductase subunit N
METVLHFFQYVLQLLHLRSLPPDFALVLPEVQLLLFGMGILLTDFLLEDQYKYWNAVMAMLGVGFSGFSLWRLTNLQADNTLGFGFSIAVDPFFIFFGMLFLVATALVVLLSVRYLTIEKENHGEYYALLLLATVGMMFMASGLDLIVEFLGLETMAISFYVLVGFLRRDRRSNEGAIKYLLLGAFSSGILAYGFSILYGLSAVTNFESMLPGVVLPARTNLLLIATAVQHRAPNDLLVMLALMTIAAGLFFKVAAVPFHQWAPDVYEGAPTTITAYVSVASSAASFALLLRLFLTVFWPVRVNWEMILAGVAIASLTLGNFAAITQTNVKRLLAYSSIAHVGYILLGLVAGNPMGLQGIAYYLLAYLFMTMGAFAILIVLKKQGLAGDELDDLNGLIKRSPTAAVLLLIFMLSLAGIPPLAGFVGKYFIFLALIESKHYVLAVFGALYIVPALYYYFRIVVHAWMRDSTDTSRPVITTAQTVALTVMCFVTLVAGIYPEPFVRLANYSLFLPFGPPSGR